MKKGRVHIVGAGPGDPGLITVKGLDCLRQADVVLYDRLIDAALFDLVPEDAEKICVGKIPGKKNMPQEEINRLMIEKAGQDKAVVRLKGGDPFVFGRGGEEAQALAENQIPFEIVPGISSALAVPAYAGIPVSHREVSSSFAVITGHEAEDKESQIDWVRIGTGPDTLIILMSVGKLEKVAANIIDAGRSPLTPAALIAAGTTSLQRTIVGPIGQIALLAKNAGIRPPAVLVAGEVVKFRSFLRWFDNRPLFGKRVLVTRAQAQARSLNQLLLRAGALPIDMPLIRIEPLTNFKECDETIRNLNRYDWIVFTSVNGVEAFFSRLYALNRDARSLGPLHVAAIGPATAHALEKKGIRPDCRPDIHTSQALLEMLQSRGLSGSRVLLPCTNISGRVLPDGLRQLGAEVLELTVYRTVPEKKNISLGKKMLLTGEIDVVTLTSPSVVVNLMDVIAGDKNVVNKSIVACIGPVTEKAAADAGLRVDVVPAQSTIEDLVNAIEAFFQRKGDK